MAEITDFGVEVKKRLLGPPSRTQSWLAAEVSSRTGLVVDAPYISKILAGRRNAPKVVRAIKEILGFPTSQIDRDKAGGGDGE